MSGMHHVELWVGDLPLAREQWGWLLEALGWRRAQDWPEGSLWQAGSGPYLVLTTPPLTAAQPHDRHRPGLNHLALSAVDQPTVDRLAQQCTDHGWRPLYAERYPFAGGPDHYAAYMEDSQGFKVEVVATDSPYLP
ncbi:VOC family protein [Actinomyces capricornis]|nr:VOC family protein [Actinomyces capricornis]